MQILELYVFVLAAFVGYMVISRVPPLLHTPLMAATNAISGISLVGSIIAAGAQHNLVCDDPRLRRCRVRDEQHRRRVPHHGSHAEDVQARRQEGPAPQASASHAMMTPASQVSYLVASVLFILGLRSLTRPDKARRGMQHGGGRHAVRHRRHAAQPHDRRLSLDRRRIGARHPHRISDGHVGADDRDAAANRALADLQRARGDARRRRRVLHGDHGRQRADARQDGGARLRDHARLDHGAAERSSPRASCRSGCRRSRSRIKGQNFVNGSCSSACSRSSSTRSPTRRSSGRSTR